MFEFVALIVTLVLTGGVASAQESEEIAEIVRALESTDQHDHLEAGSVPAFVPTEDDLRSGILTRYRNIVRQAGATSHLADERVSSLIEELEGIQASLPQAVVPVPDEDADVADSTLAGSATPNTPRPPGVLPPQDAGEFSESPDENYIGYSLADIAGRLRALADEVDKVATPSPEVQR